eukprot:CAMPEP_0117429168 /NCGR_PEP_ID=MMETSP0758-20121206/8737_1 /TAXON_ID=63605 /ORGANISM="Percolomonas cosmopolitus, Strain AE-1 (ATCC 50343)" /LENGTH=72 /DNA_ID=CAMNT_0005215977 /DNA_START=52 /DNA_END=271 /DNA_ORIENTATION=-
MTNNKQVNKKDGDQQQGGALKEAYKAEMAEVMKDKKNKYKDKKNKNNIIMLISKKKYHTMECNNTKNKTSDK